MSYQLKVIKDYPIAFWPLDESSGSTASDISGCGNNGTYHGSPATNILPLIPGGVSGTKITNTSYISLPTTKDFYGAEVSNGLGNKYSSDNDFTLEVWIHQSIESSALTPIFADSTNSIGLFWENGDIVFKVSPTDEIRWAVTYSQKSLHVVGVYSVNSISLFLDGAQVGSTMLSNNFKFTNTSLNLQVGPTTTSGDTFIVDAPAVYRYKIPNSSILRHYVDGNVATQPIHVVHPDEGTLFTCTDSKNKVAYQYVYGVSRSLKDFINDDVYYDEANKYLAFYPDSTPTPKTFTFDDIFLIPTEKNLISSKIEWRNDLGITVEASTDGVVYLSCVNGEPLPQHNKTTFNTGGVVYLRVTMETSDISLFAPRLSFLAIRFFSDKTVFADNYGDTITSSNEYSLGSLNYPVLSRNAMNGIRPKDTTGFDITTQTNIKTIEMLFTPKTTGANTLFYDPTTGTKFAWNGSGTVSKANISHFYVNGVDKTSQTNISNFLVAEEPHYIVLVLSSYVTGTLQFNYQTTGGPNNLYNNIAIYNSAFSQAKVTEHYNLYISKPSSSVEEPAITLTQLDPVYYNNDWIVIQSV